MRKPLPAKRERRAMSQRSARVIAKICQRRYAAGDRFALMRAIRVCLAAGIPVPKWAASAFVQAFDTVDSKEAASWDEVFGSPWPKGRHLASEREDDKLKWRVWDALCRKRKDEGSFAEEGRKVGLGAAKARKLYYSAAREVRELLAELPETPPRSFVIE